MQQTVMLTSTGYSVYRIVLSPRDYRLEDEQSILSFCRDSISGSVTKMKTQIKKTQYHIETRNNIKEVTAAELNSEAEATVALNAAAE